MSIDADIDPDETDIWNEMEAYLLGTSPEEPSDNQPSEFDPDAQTDLEDYLEDDAYYYTNYYQENP